MPFECGLEAGRVKVLPAAEKHYPIVGERERETIKMCRSSGSCRTVTLHRFVISCGGAGVPWVRVAAAISSSTVAPAWIERGQLNLVLPSESASASLPPCNRRPAFAEDDGLLQRVAYAGACTKVPQRAAFERVALPVGFAPVSELGARLVPAVADVQLAEAKVRSQTGAEKWSPSAFGETLVAKADSDSIVEPIRGLEPYEPAADASLTADAWVTVVRSEPPLAVAPPPTITAAQIPWRWLMLALALSTSVGLVAMRFAPADAPQPAANVRSRSDLWSVASWAPHRSVTIRKFTNAGKAVTALLDQTGAVVAELKDAGPLREVLQSELSQVRQRLAAIETAAAKNADAGGKNAPQFRALIRELERIRRIANSAAASLSRGPRGARLPATVSEAYDVLGINPDVREEVMKKIVDALRMSWHPDHARNDADRAERESRIRQINVAWELITAKRAAA